MLVDLMQCSSVTFIQFMCMILGKTHQSASSNVSEEDEMIDDPVRNVLRLNQSLHDTHVLVDFLFYQRIMGALKNGVHPSVSKLNPFRTDEEISHLDCAVHFVNRIKKKSQCLHVREYAVIACEVSNALEMIKRLETF